MTDQHPERDQVTIPESDNTWPDGPPADAGAARTALRSWRYEADAWRWVHRFNHRHANLVLRARSARVVPTSFRDRFLTMGLPADVVDETLSAIHRLSDWAEVWVETAQRFLGDFRRQTSAKNDLEAAKAQWLAALCYHSAQIVSVPGDERTVLTCRAAAASIFAQAQPYVYPDVRKIAIPWRTRTLPAYLRLPEHIDGRCGLVVLLNGASTAKEETLSWSAPFVQAGIAVLALDSPGTGNASDNEPYRADHDDILNGVYDLLATEPMLDLTRVFVAGISMGGNQAVRCAAYDRRIAGVIAVTPPYDPPRWLARASPLLTQELAFLVGSLDADVFEIAATFSLYDVAPQVRCPVLVFGAGRDLIVPSTEAQLLAHRLESRATLVWYAKGGHCLYDEIDAWTHDAAHWINAVGEARSHGPSGAKPDVESVAASARLALEEEPPRFIAEEPEDFDEGARLLDPDEIAASRDLEDPDDLDDRDFDPPSR